ncbi:MAG: hypothetical protein EOO41_05230, partial [Methanobacteriota archaeon]
RVHRARECLAATAPIALARCPSWTAFLDKARLRSPPRYFLVDCRSTPEFERGGHLPTAYHVPASALHDAEALSTLMMCFAELSGVHIAIMGAGDIRQWYHAPFIPSSTRSALAAEATPRLVPEPEAAPALKLPEEVTSHARAGAHASDYELADTSMLGSADVAVASGLDPLSANEEGDYGVGDVTRHLMLYLIQKGMRTPHTELDAPKMLSHTASCVPHACRVRSCVRVGGRLHGCASTPGALLGFSVGGARPRMVHGLLCWRSG